MKTEEVKEIHLKLREMIISGYFKPGERLVERELSDMFEISRTPVRKALKLLEEDGLVKRVPNKGVMVSKYTPKQIEEIYELRSNLEGLAAYLTTQNADKETKKKLKELVRLNEEALEREDYREANYYNEQFHSLLASASNNSLLEQTLNSMRWQLNTLLIFTWNALGRRNEIKKEHEEIVNAIIKGKPEEARKKAWEHINNAGKIALQVIYSEYNVYKDKDNVSR